MLLVDLQGADAPGQCHRQRQHNPQATTNLGEYWGRSKNSWSSWPGSGSKIRPVPILHRRVTVPREFLLRPQIFIHATQAIACCGGKLFIYQGFDFAQTDIAKIQRLFYSLPQVAKPRPKADHNMKHNIS
jgi:hypothetical protein